MPDSRENHTFFADTNDPVPSGKAGGGDIVARLYGESVTEIPGDLYIPPEALEVFLEAFEGPLDLLLYLIRRQNFNILDIPMAQLTLQYLHYVDRIRVQKLELAAEYLLMAAMLVENADEPYAQRIARAVARVYQRGESIATTAQLAAVIEGALSFLPPSQRKEDVKKSCQRTFQALRIDVNSEFEVLYAFLEKLPTVLRPGGRAAILTFHSGEDRLVKKAFKQHLRQGLYRAVSEDVTRPSAEECFRNPQARSTKLRWAIRA